MITIEKVVSILNENATGQINFSYEGIPVYGSGYSRMARAIQQGHINIRLENNLRQARLMRMLGSVHYNHLNNTLVVHSMSFLQSENIYDRALLIHEMTHALSDYQGNTINTISSECVAYIAQMMYVYRDGCDDLNKLEEFLSPLDSRVSNIFQIAWNIAKSIATTTGGYTVSDESGQSLKVAIMGISLYRRKADLDVEYDGFS